MHATLDALVGAPDWRDIRTLPRRQWESAFIALYRRQLKRHGAEFGIPFRMGDDARATTLYYLIHATKHIKGATVMKSAMAASATPGELGYAGERHHLTPLFDLDVSNLAAYLLRTLAGQTVSFDAIVARTIEETGTCRETHYNKCLKQLEKEGHVTVRRVSTTRGLSGLDEVTFPGQLALLPG